MKKIFHISCIVCIFLVGCKEEKEFLFSNMAGIQFLGQSGKALDDFTYSFIWGSPSVQRDTVYLPVQVIGGPRQFARELKVSQINEYIITYSYDDKGYVIDSTVVERTNKAIPNKHYVDFNDPGVKTLMRVEAGNVIDSLPVILLRDPSLKEGAIRLAIQLEESQDFLVGERILLTQTIVFSDKLEKPSNWNNTQWGPYSEEKHKLMINVVGNPVDEAWLKRSSDEKGMRVFWRGKFIEALTSFNKDPDNIASGMAPLREDIGNPNSNLVSFPEGIN